MSTVLFVLGPPGVGKTTMIRNLVPECVPDPPYCMSETPRCEIPTPKWTIIRRVALAGHWRGTAFDGGDTVPYTGARAALEYWRDKLLPTVDLTIFDGDRFSTKPSLEFIQAAGVRIVGAYLTAPEDKLVGRRSQRGSNQNETWMKGRTTKAANFARLIHATEYDTSAGVVEVVAAIHSLLGRREAA